MPAYDYRCTECPWEGELSHGMYKDYPPCPECGGELKKKFHTLNEIWHFVSTRLEKRFQPKPWERPIDKRTGFFEDEEPVVKEQFPGIDIPKEK